LVLDLSALLRSVEMRTTVRGRRAGARELAAVVHDLYERHHTVKDLMSPAHREEARREPRGVSCVSEFEQRFEVHAQEGAWRELVEEASAA
jgi:hypothetical protein